MLHLLTAYVGGARPLLAMDGVAKRRHSHGTPTERAGNSNGIARSTTERGATSVSRRSVDAAFASGRKAKREGALLDGAMAVCPSLDNGLIARTGAPSYLRMAGVVGFDSPRRLQPALPRRLFP